MRGRAKDSACTHLLRWSANVCSAWFSPPEIEDAELPTANFRAASGGPFLTPAPRGHAVMQSCRWTNLGPLRDFQSAAGEPFAALAVHSLRQWRKRFK